MSTLVTLRPTSAPIASGSWDNLGGAASIAAALADSSDTTRIQNSYGVGYNDVRPFFATLSPPAGAQIRSVTPRVRCLTGAAAVNGLTFGLINPTGIGPTYYVPTNASTLTTYTGVTSAAQLDGSAWTAAAVNATQVRIIGGDANSGCVVYEAYLDVVYNEAPAATASGPSGSVLTTRPAISWSYSDPDADVQERYRVKVFTAAQYGAGGFDPNTSTPALDSGEVFGAATSWTPTTDLVNGTTYRAFIFVADAGSGGRYNVVSTSGPYTGFTVNITPPAAPTVASVTADSAHMRHVIAVQDNQNMLSDDGASFETATGGWTALVNCSLARSAYGGASNGGYVLDITATGAGLVQAGSALVACTVGVNYAAQAKFFSVTAARTVRCDLKFYDSGSSLLASYAGSAVAVANPGSGISYVTAAAPTGAAYVQAVATVLSAGAGEHWYVDTAAVVPGTSTSFAWTRGGLVGPARMQIQRSDDVGITWRTLNRLYVVGVGVGDLSVFDYSDVSQAFTTYDYEAPRDSTAVYYRARVLAVVSGSYIVSPWSDGIGGVSLAATGTWIKDPIDPTRNLAVAADQHQITRSRDEGQGIHYALGRADPIVVHGTARLATFDLALFFLNDAAYAAWKVLQDSARTLLLQTCYGDAAPEQCYFTVDPAVQTEVLTVDGQAQAQPRRASFTAREALLP